MNVGRRTRLGWLTRTFSDFLLVRSRLEKRARRNGGRKISVAPTNTET